MKPFLVELISQAHLGKMETGKNQLMQEHLVGQADQNKNILLVEAGTASSISKTGEETIPHQEVILVEVVVDHLEMEMEDQGHGMGTEVKDLEEDLPRPCCTA